MKTHIFFIVIGLLLASCDNRNNSDLPDFLAEKILNDNLMLDYVDAFTLIKYLKDKNQNKEETSQLNDLVKQLTETSNPVLIILRNK